MPTRQGKRRNKISNLNVDSQNESTETVTVQQSSRRKLVKKGKCVPVKSKNTMKETQNLEQHINNNATLYPLSEMQTRFKARSKMEQNGISNFDHHISNFIAGEVSTKVRHGDGVEVCVDNNAEAELDYDFTEEEAARLAGDSQTSDDSMEADAELILNPERAVASDASDLSEEQKLLQNNPGLKQLFNKMLDERIKQATKTGKSSSSQLLTRMTPQCETNTGTNLI